MFWRTFIFVAVRAIFYHRYGWREVCRTCRQKCLYRTKRNPGVRPKRCVSLQKCIMIHYAMHNFRFLFMGTFSPKCRITQILSRQGEILRRAWGGSSRRYNILVYGSCAHHIYRHCRAQRVKRIAMPIKCIKMQFCGIMSL